MKLRSVRLHPFGAVVDRTYSFDDGLQVLVGENEFGKSTLREALRLALFVPTELGLSDQREKIDPWLPLPDGKTAAVTIKLEVGGVEFTLEKCWGGGRRSTLRDGLTGMVISDPSEVDRKVDFLRGYSLPSYQSVFVVSQAEVAGTVAALRVEGGRLIGQASAIASGLRQVTGDVDLQVLRKEVASRRDAAFSRWDRKRNSPEISASGQGGVGKPWVKSVGAVLSTWYAAREAEAAVARRTDFERRLDQLNESRRVADEQVTRLVPEVRDDGERLKALRQRHAQELRVQSMKDGLDRKRGILREWTEAELSLPRLRQREEELCKIKDRLDSEFGAASRHAETQSVRDQIKRIDTANKEYETAKQAFGQLSTIIPADVDQAMDLRRRLDHCSVKISAQRLRADIASDHATSIEVVSGVGQPQTFVISPASVERVEVQGRIVVRGEGLTVVVSSALEDIGALIEQSDGLRKDLEQSLGAYGCATVEELSALYQRYVKAQKDLEDKQRRLKEELKGRDLSDWKTQEQQFANAPASRSLADIQPDLAETTQQLSEVRGQIRGVTSSIEGWKADWSDRSTLDDRILDEAVVERQARDERDKLPMLPPEEGDLEGFERRCEERSEQLEKARAAAQEARIALAGLPDPGEIDLESLREAETLKLEEHRRALAKAEALDRILAAIDAVHGTADPYAAIGARVEGIFTTLSGGKYRRLDSRDGLPNALIREDGSSLPVPRLSQGTSVLLALAVRFAFAESLLSERPMFMLLDDPLVDLDAARRSRVAEELRRLGQLTQVVVLTCHEGHAELLGPGRVTAV